MKARAAIRTPTASVQIAQQSRDQDGRQRQEHQAEAQAQPGRALGEPDESDEAAGTARFALATDAR